MAIRCEVCGKGPAPERGGVTVHRQKETGVTGIWRCDEHNGVTIDPETQRIVDVLEGHVGTEARA